MLGGDDYPPQSSAGVMKTVKLYSLLPLWVFMACFRVTFTFYNQYGRMCLHVYNNILLQSVYVYVYM